MGNSKGLIVTEYIKTKYRRAMIRSSSKPSKDLADKADGDKCPKCGRVISLKVGIELHQQLEPDCDK